MFEEKEKLKKTQTENNAFIQSLPTFSLPPNLNDKLVINKKQQQRPRLSNLRSTLISKQMTEQSDEYYDDNLIKVDLPPMTTKILFQEIRYYNTIAILLCLITTVLNCYVYQKVIFSIFIGQWIILFAWHKIGGTELSRLQLSTSSCLIFILLTTIFYSNRICWWYQLPSMISLILFGFGFRLISLNEKIHHHQTNYLKETKDMIQNKLLNYYGKRQLFLSTISQEIRDASLMVIATIEQFSPPSLLTHTHELLNACSIAVPIASISAIHTTIKQACHISSHLNLISKMLQNNEEQQLKSTVKVDFDLSEMIQSVGDALAGMSAKLGVHFVIYHTDNGLYYTNVMGDEDAIQHALINLLRNILEGCTPGACIELGLHVSPIQDTPKVKVLFDIIQTASPAIPIGVSSAAIIPNANFTTQLLNYIDGEMKLEDVGKNQTKVEISLELFQGSREQKLLFIEKRSNVLDKHLSNIKFSNEPSLEELTKFITMLKGVKMILHGPEKSIFAKHLTSCLTSWNTDISHVPVIGYTNNNEQEEFDFDLSSVNSTVHSVLSSASNRSINSNNNNTTTSSSNKVPSPAIEEDHIHSIPPTFILIDDDILTLEKKLSEFRDQPLLPPQPPQQQKRHRRSKSRNDVLQGTIAIIFFTSLTNYRRVRDIVHWISTVELPRSMPRVVVVPKPAGPRRFLTALHTAWNNPVVEPQFIPIATSPLSPFMSQPSNQELNSTGSVTPGGAPPPPLMTPHDVNTRFSPGRRTGMRVHSPSGLNVESEKGNYFFEASPRQTTTPGILNSSPLLTSTVQTPGRLRSQSFRRNLVDLALPEKPIPVQEEQVANTQDTNQVLVDEGKTKPKSKFSFRISNRKRKERSNVSDKPSPPIKVLIVEDNMINQAILSTWMKKHSIKFSVACDGKEAVEKWEGGGFHLILMDIQLPVMNGIDATKKIRGIEKERKIGVLPSHGQTPVDSSFQSPVIIVALTASSLESDRQAALAAGCNDFLTKPVSLEWLEKKITEWGCMQALIDFEGWRKWKRATDESPITAAATASAALKSKLRKEAILANSTTSLKEVNTIEKENLVARTKELLKDEWRGIVLVGMNKRRTSCVEDRSDLKDRKLRLSELTIPKQLEERKRIEEEKQENDDDEDV